MDYAGLGEVGRVSYNAHPLLDVGSLLLLLLSLPLLLVLLSLPLLPPLLLLLPLEVVGSDLAVSRRAPLPPCPLPPPPRALLRLTLPLLVVLLLLPLLLLLRTVWLPPRRSALPSSSVRAWGSLRPRPDCAASAVAAVAAAAEAAPAGAEAA